MPWYGYAVITLGLGYWGWVGAMIVSLLMKVAKIRGEIDAEKESRQHDSARHFGLIQDVQAKVMELAEGQSEAVGKLDVVIGLLKGTKE